MIPLALEVGSHRARTAAGDQKVTAKLKIQSFEIEISRAFLHALQSLIDRDGTQAFICGRRRSSRRKIQSHAPKEPLMIPHVGGAKLSERFVGARQIFSTAGRRVAGAKLGGRGEQKRRGVCALHKDFISVNVEATASRENLQFAAELNPNLALERMTLVTWNRFAFDYYPVRIKRECFAVLFTSERS
jgi:hypothetical protein